ncbi:MAG: hypothetical protein ACR2F1_14850 [Nitrososphaeraceae archaeon]
MQSDNSLTFDDPLLGVKFQYTDEWVKEGSSLYGAKTECPSLPCMRFPVISVNTYPIVAEDFSLEDYTKEQSYYHDLAEGYKPIALNETKIGEKNAIQYIYSTRSPFLMEEASSDIINYEIYTTEGINLYKISFTATSDIQFDENLQSFNKVIDTFEIVR